jgi:hypothetical protein
VVGGTPAYRRFVHDDSPAGLADFDQWVIRTVLDPGTPLFREARYLLEEEAGIRDTALYHSTLAAVAAGNHTRGGIANYVGRKAADIGHHLNVLEDSGLLRREPDVFRSGRSCYRVAEPLITFYQVVMRPQWGLLESGRGGGVWADARPRFLAQVAGPHFEQLCREYALTASVTTFGGIPGEVGAARFRGGAEGGDRAVCRRPAGLCSCGYEFLGAGRDTRTGGRSCLARCHAAGRAGLRRGGRGGCGQSPAPP